MRTYRSSPSSLRPLWRFSGAQQSWFPAIHQKTFPGTPSTGVTKSALFTRRHSTFIIGLSFTFLGMIAPSAFAETTPTMNQPDNGFFEGPNPEWATLHSTDVRGTEDHRQYHRDAVQAHLLWHQQNQSQRDTAAYENAHRIFHQDRNMLHREFHTAPLNP